jgi:hypothetical protein
VTAEDLLLGIVSALVDDPSEACVTSAARASGTEFQVIVAPADVGKIIGKDGRTARSIRGLLSAMGIAAKTRYGLSIVTRR